MTRISGSLASRVHPQKERSLEQSKRGLPASAAKRCWSPSRMLTPAPHAWLIIDLIFHAITLFKPVAGCVQILFPAVLVSLCFSPWQPEA